mmetsp:Transcript_33858/g.52807  ORF Transcript_33858/g.52807 Transcript_33858/m.52807 type:complete len:348 (+) Transcript_33858:290-1333(+)
MAAMRALRLAALALRLARRAALALLARRARSLLRSLAMRGEGRRRVLEARRFLSDTMRFGMRRLSLWRFFSMRLTAASLRPCVFTCFLRQTWRRRQIQLHFFFLGMVPRLPRIFLMLLLSIFFTWLLRRHLRMRAKRFLSEGLTRSLNVFFFWVLGLGLRRVIMALILAMLSLPFRRARRFLAVWFFLAASLRRNCLNFLTRSVLEKKAKTFLIRAVLEVYQAALGCLLTPPFLVFLALGAFLPFLPPTNFFLSRDGTFFFTPCAFLPFLVLANLPEVMCLGERADFLARWRWEPAGPRRGLRRPVARPTFLVGFLAAFLAGFFRSFFISLFTLPIDLCFLEECFFL